MLDAAVLDVPVGETVPALLASGLVSRADVADAHRVAEEQALTTLQVLIDNGAVSRTDAVRTASAAAGLDYVELAEYGVDASAAALLPAEFARRATVLPLGREDGVLIVAVTIRQAGNIELKDDLARLTRHRTRFVVARSADIVAKIGQVYRAAGVLHDAHHSPKTIQNGVISRLKIMSDMNIAERRVPQDGRMSVNHQGRKVDLRVATLPTVWGEKVVARILDNGNTQLALDDLGFSDTNYAHFRAAYSRPYGMILATGPTGSGKSTTLYATLNLLNRQEVNVITGEDPVEYRLPGINQVQTNPRAGLTFASALRSILRSDPDIVLIGEIRDPGTAQIAVEAALTAHLVLSTLHTNDAASAVTRLIEMGIEPFLVGSALDAVVAQRLCRLLCERCKVPYQPEPPELLDAGFTWRPDLPLPTLYRPVGCSACSNTGYLGRMALHEVMTVTEEIERLAVAGHGDTARRRLAEGLAGHDIGRGDSPGRRLSACRSQAGPSGRRQPSGPCPRADPEEYS